MTSAKNLSLVYDIKMKYLKRFTIQSQCDPELGSRSTNFTNILDMTKEYFCQTSMPLVLIKSYKLLLHK